VRHLLRRVGVLLGLALAVVVTSAHVGSPDTWFQGMAGPYPVQVVVRLPGVVPGLGQIDVAVTGDSATVRGVSRVTAQPLIFNAGPEGAPPPDVAKPVPGQPGSWHAELWFMAQASFRVRIEVTGANGSGAVDVPVVAMALRQTPLAPWLGAVLLAVGAFLFVGAVTIIRAGATDAITRPGASPASRRAGLVAPVAGAAILGLMLWGGWTWWQAVEREYVQGLYRPVPATATVDTTGGTRTLAFTVTDANWMVQRIGLRPVESLIIPDHGKLMHLFAIERVAGDSVAQSATGGGFGHFHPITTDSLTFRTPLGSLPPGRYDLYADVVQETGFPQTLVATVDVPPLRTGDAAALADESDAVFTGPAGVAAAGAGGGAGRGSGDRFPLADGGALTWDRRPDSLMAGRDAGLRFTVRHADGSVANLTPYLGMAGHAVVQRTDGGVYIHLHPNGTVSMGAQAALAMREATDTAPGMVARRVSAAPMDHAAHHSPSFDGTLVFPYAFPEPGEYRVWVQFRREGRGEIETGVFRVVVVR
jgi:hypothetical protein